MKTLYITFVTLVLTTSLLSQNYLVSNTTRSYKTQPSTSISSFVVEVIDDTTFDYREFLSQSSDSQSRFRIGSERVSKRELTKIFRKGSRKSENVGQFKNYLSENYPRLSSQLSTMEIGLLFEQFSKGTVTRYLNELPSIL
ncbi:hypothetical protein EAX61_04855 [Dokdonia sinensis]|uniref:DUF4476 domain-containing protein n=1 Tax=Dokdonia sinensis TaxID=2479847 RepID=A0A3M0GEI7_9FLAO|nr:hypothetical protein [Dokdonia sinensis]RMB62907.1 hypothetical protein EAX61_04855 [Dokdonia sinensis]